MQLYNKIMSYFWLFAGFAILIFITYKCLTDDVRKWGFYYIFVVTSFGMYFFKKWMMKRMEKHMQYLEEKQTNEK